MARPDAQFYWVNRYAPFMIGNETPAQSGRVAVVRTETADDAGKPMVVMFRLATRAQILAWKNLAEGNTVFNTTAIDSSFVTGHTVIFSQRSPIEYQNELGLQDIDIGVTSVFTSKPGFDYWRGVLNLIIVT